jgi:hypothetical protein
MRKEERGLRIEEKKSSFLFPSSSLLKIKQP